MQCLLFLLLLLQASDMQRPDLVAAMEADWAEVIKPIPIDDGLRHWFWRLDPRKPSTFQAFPRERLDPVILRDARRWCNGCFSTLANPYKNDAQKSLKYSLAPHPGRQCLLRYEWKAGRYHFVFLEGSAAFLLEVRLHGTTSDKRWSTLWKREEVVRLIQDVFLPVISEDQKWLRSLEIPPDLSVGEHFTNAPGYIPETGEVWPPHILGIPGNGVFWLMLLKADPWSAKSWGYPEDHRWLPVSLYTTDGRSLLIEHLWGGSYPRNPPPAPLYPAWKN